MRFSNTFFGFGLAVGMVLVASPDVNAQSAQSVTAADPAQQKVSTTRFEAQCPEEVRTKQAPAAPIKGWATHVETINSRQIFTAAYLYEGHPRDGVQLLASADPVQTANQSAPTGTTYVIPEGKDVFLVCYYGNTLVRLIHKLPKGVNSCVVKYSETLGHVQKAVCE